MVNALERVEEPQARTELSERDARGGVDALSRALRSVAATPAPVDRPEPRISGLRMAMTELKPAIRSDIAALRVEMRQAIRAQSIWLASAASGAVGLVIAPEKRIP